MSVHLLSMSRNDRLIKYYYLIKTLETLSLIYSQLSQFYHLTMALAVSNSLVNPATTQWFTRKVIKVKTTAVNLSIVLEHY